MRMKSIEKYELLFRENLAYGKLSYVNNLDFIIKLMSEVGLPSDMEKDLSCILSTSYADGKGLSGGEWQKVAIARSISKDSELMVFDEPTAALDTIAELKIYDLLMKIIKEKTSIIISHRLGITKYCDKILVMDEGDLVEFGAHSELLEKKGLYYKLYKEQAKMYDFSIF